MNHRSGYSLFEVLLAFTILAMVLAVLLPGQSNLLRRANDAPARLLALDYAASRLAAIGVETAPQPGNTEYRYRDWLVQTEIKNDATNITNLPLLHIDVKVLAVFDGRLLAAMESWRPVE